MLQLPQLHDLVDDDLEDGGSLVIRVRPVAAMHLDGERGGYHREQTGLSPLLEC